MGLSPGPTGAALGATGSRLGRRDLPAMKDDVVIQQLDERRYAVAVDGVVRYVGSQEECQRRAQILSPKNDRKVQDRGLVRACRLTATAD
jgi:hypothetical protein